MIEGTFIDGKKVESSGPKNVGKIINPATEEVIEEIVWSSETDVDMAVQSAEKAFKTWSKKNVEKRAEVLRKAAKLLTSKTMEIAKTEVENSGCTMRKALGDVNFAAANLRAFSHLATELLHDNVRIEENLFINFSFVRREPLGVCGCIIPWNFPLLMAVWKVAPAIVMGNTVVLKPAPQTPLTAFMLAEIFLEAGLPEGVFNIVTGDAETGGALVKHPSIRKISFTGSTAVGKRIYELASGRIERITLELGGKNPFVVFDDADLNLAIDGALFANFYHSGQVCTSGSRVLVHSSIYDEFLSRVKERAERIKVGDPMDMTTGMGPLISAEHRDKVESYIKKGTEEGATLVTGGSRPEHLEKGYYIKPTIFTDVKPGMSIERDEIFGPVMSIIKFKNEEEAVSIANDTNYGLAASVWSSNLTRAAGVARKIQAGTVWINEHHILNPYAPFGGYKESGIGRELGKSGLLAYTEEKHVSTSLVNERQRRMWYDALF